MTYIYIDAYYLFIYTIEMNYVLCKTHHCILSKKASWQLAQAASDLNTLIVKVLTIAWCWTVWSESMAGVVASKVRRARVKSLIDKEEQNGKGSIAINPLQECTNKLYSKFISNLSKMLNMNITILCTSLGSTIHHTSSNNNCE